MVTKSNWKIYCGPTSNNQGEGFIGIAPNGDRYEFSRRVAYRHKHENRYFLFTEAFFVTKITDVYGNWVRYNYNDGGKLSITSNDGRRIDYSGGRAIANGRTWTFGHSTNPNLELGFKVTLPDGTYWEMGRLKNSGTYSPFQVFSRDREQCPHFDWQDYYIKHPAGSTATFSFDVILNGKYKLSDPIENIDYGPHITGLPEISSCGPVGNPLSHPSVFRSLAVTKKVVTVPQDGTHTWTWEYNNQDYGSYETFGSGRNSTIGPIKTRKTTKPDGSYMITHVNRQFGKMEGQIEKIESFDVNDRLLETEVFSYAYSPQPIGFGTGQNFRQVSQGVRHRSYQTSRILTRDGESYTTAREFQTNPAASDFAYGAPRKVSQSSTLNSGTRTTETTYEHRKDKWILGLPKTVTRNGKLFTQNTYNNLGQLTRSDQFGVRQASLTYYGDGTLRTFSDALNRTTVLKNYKRGTPQRFELPENTVVTQTVDDNGWITDQTNARGHTTSLTYDAGGRVTRVNRPGALGDINIAYSGLGTGNLTRTVTEGSARTITKHDGFLRPYETRQQALSGGGGSIFTRTEYDALNRVTFQSFPQTSLAAATTGVETTYDGLGRVIETRENIAPFATTTTRYLSNNRTRVTDPEGNVTTSYASGYGSPDDGNTIRIDQPERVLTSMAYDIYGNLTRATRDGLSQRWAYDNRLRVCNSFTPETRGRRYQYDDANQVIAYAEGHTQSCGNLSSSGRVLNTYDDLGRITRIDYPRGTPDVTMTYDANGNITRNRRADADWTYTYDTNDQLLSESLAIDGRTYTLTNFYNANGHITQRRSPSGRLTQFAPDGFGRPTMARNAGNTWASGATYHANGQLKSLNYLNDFTYTTTQTARQQTLRARAAMMTVPTPMMGLAVLSGPLAFGAPRPINTMPSTISCQNPSARARSPCNMIAATASPAPRTAPRQVPSAATPMMRAAMSSAMALTSSFTTAPTSPPPCPAGAPRAALNMMAITSALNRSSMARRFTRSIRSVERWSTAITSPPGRIPTISSLVQVG